MVGHRCVTAWLALVCLVVFSGCEEPAGEEPLAPEGEEESMLVSPGNDTTPLWEIENPDLDFSSVEALLALLNEIRADLKLGPVSLNASLTEAATSHAEFLAIHKSHFDVPGTSIHKQPKDLEGFTGEGYEQRAAFFGYQGKCFGEVVAFKPTAVGALRSWMETVYHRIPLLEPDATDIGYGEAEVDGLGVNVLEVGFHE